MINQISHVSGVSRTKEVLFRTPFNYFFPHAARSKKCLLPVAPATERYLRELGLIMGSPLGAKDGTQRKDEDIDSVIDAIFTYFGQFIDHDLTARTDRDGDFTSIGTGAELIPHDPDVVIENLQNGRRPVLDLDSVFGDGPALSPSVTTESQHLYDDDLKLKIFELEAAGKRGKILDLPRKLDNDGSSVAQIADMRNDENVMISQLHAGFIKFYNAVYDEVKAQDEKLVAEKGGEKLSKEKIYSLARQLVTWSYQFAVVDDYLNAVCDKNVVFDGLLNGPRFVGAPAGRSNVFMPLEFSVAGFRFGHTMIRPDYQLQPHGKKFNLMDLLNVANPKGIALDNGDNNDGTPQLRSSWVIDWNLFVSASQKKSEAQIADAPRQEEVEASDAADDGIKPQKARRLDPFIAQGLENLGGERAGDPILGHLAISNLLRGYDLSIPTGQAMCDAFGINPIPPERIRGEDVKDKEGKVIIPGDSDKKIQKLFNEAPFTARTPLWFYVLREAQITQGGRRLGELGSQIVVDTMMNLIKQDPNSYWNNRGISDVIKTDSHGLVCGIEIGDSTIKSLRDILLFAGVLTPPPEKIAEA